MLPSIISASSDPSAPPLLDEIKRAYEEGRWADGAEMGESLLQADETDASVFYWLALIAWHHNDYRLSRRYLTQLECLPNEAETHIFLKGRVAMALGEYQHAEQHLLQAHMREPESIEVLEALASLYSKEQKYSQAIVYYQHLVMQLPDQLSPRLALAECCRADNQNGEAIKQYLWILQRDSNHVLALSHLGSIWQQQGRMSEAIACYERVLNLEPDSVAIWVKMGQAHADKHQYEAAATAYQQALRLDGEKMEVILAYARLLLLSGRQDEALSHLNQIPDSDPHFQTAQALKTVTVLPNP